MEEDQIQLPETIQTSQILKEKKNRKQKWEENKCMDISNYKQAKYHSRKFRHDEERENLQRETEFFLTATQNNAIYTYYVKTRIDKTQQNSRCRLCGDRDKTITHKISAN